MNTTVRSSSNTRFVFATQEWASLEAKLYNPRTREPLCRTSKAFVVRMPHILSISSSLNWSLLRVFLRTKLRLFIYYVIVLQKKKILLSTKTCGMTCCVKYSPSQSTITQTVLCCTVKLHHRSHSSSSCFAKTRTVYIWSDRSIPLCHRGKICNVKYFQNQIHIFFH